jgi:ribosomal protein S18 acetylase RimI-like enzyme
MSQLLDRSRLAHVAAWLVHTRAIGGEIVERDGLITCFTGAPSAMFNPTIARAAGFSEALPALEKEYEARGVQFGFLADERFSAEAIEAAGRLGLHANPPAPSMVLHPAPDLAAPAADVRVIRDAAGLEQHIHAQVAGFGSDLDELRIFNRVSVLSSAECYYLAYDEGVPAATATMVATGREAGIFAVSTHPDRRRRGLGRAVTVAAIRDAVAAGCDLIYLQATAMGYPLYVGLDFRTVEHHRTFVRSPDHHEA